MTQNKPKTKTSLLDDSYSSYWLDDSTGVFDDVTDTDSVEKETSSVERIMKLAAIRRATTNFVRILTNDPKIQVKYSSGKESYTDGKTVVISADDNPKRFDSMVGLALHEASHCLLSDFEFLRSVTTDPYIFYGSMHPKLRKMFPLTNDWNMNQNNIGTLREYIMFIMNIIEDRRIDSYVYRSAPGYRPYYDAMYKRYFFNKDIENNLLRNPDWRIPTIENYMNWLLMTFSPHFNPRAMKGLTKMTRMIDLPNIRKYDTDAMMPFAGEWESTGTITDPATKGTVNVYDFTQFSPLWKTANELMVEILRQAHFEAKKQQKPMEFGTGTASPNDMDGEEPDDMSDELENLDPSVAQGKFNPEKAKRAMKKMKDMMEGRGTRKKLKRGEAEQISSMESASAKMEESSDPIYGKIRCLVTRKFNRAILTSGWFPFTRCSHYNYNTNDTLYVDKDSEEGVVAGVRMGAILAHRLQVRNDPTVTHFTRQQQGKVDRRILAQLGMDIENVFKRTTVENFRPAMLHLSIDASGSMYGGKWRQVVAVATALAYASDKVRNLDVVITLRGNISSGIPTVAVVYDSRTDNFKKARSLFPYLSTSGSTPEGLCYTATMDLIQECASTHSVFFINFSDGEPGCSYGFDGHYVNYHGEEAVRQTRNAVRAIKEAGIRVMSYFIKEYGDVHGYSRKTFTEMYGQDAEFVNVRNVTQVLRTLNKLLLVRD